MNCIKKEHEDQQLLLLKNIKVRNIPIQVKSQAGQIRKRMDVTIGKRLQLAQVFTGTIAIQLTALSGGQQLFRL
jgi:hypothetical protein